MLTASVGFLVAQSKGFRVLADRSAGVQNGRFGRDILRQEVRTAGTNVTEEQPTIVYAGSDVFAFNSDLTTNRADSNSTTVIAKQDKKVRAQWGSATPFLPTRSATISQKKQRRSAR